MSVRVYNGRAELVKKKSDSSASEPAVTPLLLRSQMVFKEFKRF